MARTVVAAETNVRSEWETLTRYRGAHPFIVSKLGSVVDAEDMAGIYHYERDPKRLSQTQGALPTAPRYLPLLLRRTRR